MKNCVVCILLVAALFQFSLASSNEEFQATVEEFAKASRSLDDQRESEVLSHWSGNSSMEGVRLIVREIVKPGGFPSRRNFIEMLEQSAVPKEQIVTYLLDEASKASRDEVSLAFPYQRILKYFAGDRRVVDFLSDSLDDKRVPSPPPAAVRGENAGHQPFRVCDGAFGTIVFILAERNEVNSGDSMFGDPSGELLQSKRDQLIENLKLVLRGKGYGASKISEEPGKSEKPADSVSRFASLPLGEVGVPPSSQVSKRLENKPGSDGVRASPDVSSISWMRWGMILAGVVSAGGFITWRFFRKSRTVST